jgi:hypothetical protein
MRTPATAVNGHCIAAPFISPAAQADSAKLAPDIGGTHAQHD